MDFKLSLDYESHLPVLMQAVKKTRGDILELGAGVFSTPFLHWTSVNERRNLLTLDNNESWVKLFAKPYQNSFHKLLYVGNWGKAPIDKKWDVVLVDHSPAERRIVEIKRLANLAKYIVIHDSNGRFENEYHYSKIYPLFKYKFDFTAGKPSTTVLSNFASVRNFA